MWTESKTMQELHKIREQLHDEQKNWTSKQIIDFYRQETEKTAKEFGMHLKRRPHVQRQRKAG
jgi:hypothetical protein